MGQKTNPIGFRISTNKSYSWESMWYSDESSFSEKLVEDINIRKFLLHKFKFSSTSKIVIERPSNRLNITIHSSKPGVIIGKKGADIAKLKSKLSPLTKVKMSEISINILNIDKPEMDAGIVSQSIAQQLEKRMSFRKAIKRAIVSAMKVGAKGIRVNVKGRIGGSDIARMEWYREGAVPLHTIRARIDYAHAPSYTKDGVVGVKVWVYSKDQNEKDKNLQIKDNVTSKKR
jgi:small subunit ribosomal protein S3